MGFPDNVLAKGEKVERDLHPHWLTVVVPTIFGLLLTAACVFIVIQTPDDETGNRIQWIAVAVLVLVAIPAVVVPYLRWRTTHYVITSHRVMVRRGILTKQGKDITLSKITDVSFQQTLVDRMIRAGSLHIESAGDSPDENLTNIPNSNVVQQLINRLIDEDDLRRRHGRGYAPEASGPYDGDGGRGDVGRGERDLDGVDTTAVPQGERPARPELAEERRREPRDLSGAGD
ncbi:PH (Pleckstrin Homology) domain-containing protein [Humibacillus xanthopallidus]|uniref:PH (Pleckstrin Homology) domain-containing protein n=1 Tax=Humibacillus xanthopallidus TaxID=412689 RepID=A0A543PPP7_9MICO|nr:PH domain-containing protein [Humibacillus xanthopallidus]TQN46054.1 PH (Pleckstrin Homology) domain-containing protein [Humibacillus xanthopallidus]